MANQVPVDNKVRSFFSNKYSPAALSELQSAFTVVRSNAGLTDGFLGSEYNIKAALSGALEEKVQNFFRPAGSSNSWLDLAVLSVDRKTAEIAEAAIRTAAGVKWDNPGIEKAIDAEVKMQDLSNDIEMKKQANQSSLSLTPLMESKRGTGGPVRLYTDDDDNDEEEKLDDATLTRMARDVLKHEQFVREYASAINQQTAKGQPLARARERLQGIRSRSSETMKTLEDVLLKVEESLNQPPDPQRRQYEDDLRVQLEDAARDADVVLPRS
jgi:hypothetical protein